MTSIIRDSWSLVVNGTDGLHHDDFFQLACVYSQPNRRYHNLTHITQMAGQLLAIDLASTSDDRRSDLHRAIWWHDSIYDSQAKDNEERSADDMVETLRSWGVDRAECDRAHMLVMATKHHIVLNGDEEAKLLVDLDLSILAASDAQYKVYAAAVREEYCWLTDEHYGKGRLAFLHSMLKRQRIFLTPHFSEVHESLARSNMEGEANGLGSVYKS